MTGDWPTELPVSRASAGPALRALHAAGRLDLPLPGAGRTLARWTALAELSAADLSLGRLAEAHADAVAILAELAGPPAAELTGPPAVGLAGPPAAELAGPPAAELAGPPAAELAGPPAAELAGPPAAELWGVWAAEPPTARVTATDGPDGWTLSGRKAWCSGAEFLDRALVTAHAGDGRRLFAVAVADLAVEPGSWAAVGMAATGTVTVGLDAVPAVPVGGPGAYLDRPGFWHGGAGVAACWYGGALGAARLLLAAARHRPPDPHALAHLGAVDALVAGLAAHLATAAAEIDADPAGPGARLRQARLRARVEAGATEILDRVGRALGPGPLATDPVHAQRAADLPVYLRQSHAERDLAALGELAAESAAW